MSIPRSDLLHRPLIIYAVFGTCISWRIGPVFSTCWGTKFSDVLVPVELARSFLRLCRWPNVNTHSFCHGSIQICFWGPYQLGPACVPSITESVESYFSACQRTNVYFLQRLRPLPRFSVWKHHIFALGCLCGTPGFPFSWLLLSSVSLSVWHTSTLVHSKWNWCVSIHLVLCISTWFEHQKVQKCLSGQLTAF